MKKYIIQSDTFDAPFLLLVCKDSKQAADFLNAQQTVKSDDDKFYSVPDSTMGSASQVGHDFKCGVRRVIWLRKFNKRNLDDVGVLIHELNHYVIGTLRDKGIWLDSKGSSEEAYTYLLESVFKKCWKVLK